MPLRGLDYHPIQKSKVMEIKEVKINDVLCAKYQITGTTLFMKIIPNKLVGEIADAVFEEFIANTICIIEQRGFNMVSYLNID